MGICSKATSRYLEVNPAWEQAMGIEPRRGADRALRVGLGLYTEADRAP
jgi:hypothetical protein